MEEHAQILDGPITPEEVLATIKSLKNNKPPGNDGFPAEFYKQFSQQLTSPLILTLNDIITSGTFPLSWNSAAIVVLPKKDKHIECEVPQAYSTTKSRL